MSALQAGSIAPDFSLPDCNGEMQSLSDALKKGMLLLTFFKVSCPTCQYALPFFNRLHLAIPKSAVTLWTISQNNPLETKNFNREFGIDLPQLFDLEEKNFPVSNAYGITHVPSSFLIRQDGSIATSSVSWDKVEFESINKQLVAAASTPDFTIFNAGERILDYRPG